ncbi:hypothetical protein ACMUM0_12035, partial [Enterococcus faecalis]|uniref:hypothetical protein n=1 Tax=Enterococcus faecalis TaxID=1351 RepID=UPI003B7BBA01
QSKNCIKIEWKNPLYKKSNFLGSLHYGGRLFFFQFLSPAKIEGISENFNALSGNNSGFMV